MFIKHILSQETVEIDPTSESKTAVFSKISQLLTKLNPSLEVGPIFDTFWQRDALGCPSIGQGILIPHIRLANITQAQGAFIRLLHPVDFQAEDKQPIDLVFGLLVPENKADQHLQTLKEVIQLLSQAEVRELCRKASSNLALYEVLTKTAPIGGEELSPEEWI